MVYKPIAGEQPLWDLPDGCLAHREVAAHLVSEVLGWNIVPRTWLRDGPFSEGIVQLWQETDPGQTAVDLVPADDVPDTGWKQVLEGEDQEVEDQNGRIVALIHEGTPALRRMAVFDVLVNNADRKGDHVLAMDDGHRYSVDHGLTFHSENKLRTVLWGWIGEALSAEELAGVDRVHEGLQGELGQQLTDLLTNEETASLAALRPATPGGAVSGSKPSDVSGPLAAVLRKLRLPASQAVALSWPFSPAMSWSGFTNGSTIAAVR